jgi:hypothetical protein
MKYIKLFENINDQDIIGAKVGDIVVCISPSILHKYHQIIKINKRYEILEIFNHINDLKNDIVKYSEDQITVKDAETNEVFWSPENNEKMRKFYAWRFIPEHIHDAKRYNI